MEGAAVRVERCEVAEDLEEDVLGDVFGVGAVVGEAVADAVDAFVLGGDELMPGASVAGEAEGDELGEGVLLGLLLGGPLHAGLGGSGRRGQFTGRGLVGFAADWPGGAEGGGEGVRDGEYAHGEAIRGGAGEVP